MEAEIICEENEDYLNTGRFPFHISLHNVVSEVFTLTEELNKAFSKLFTTSGTGSIVKDGFPTKHFTLRLMLTTLYPQFSGLRNSSAVFSKKEKQEI